LKDLREYTRKLETIHVYLTNHINTARGQAIGMVGTKKVAFVIPEERELEFPAHKL